jgi:ribosomal protein L7/L12
MTLRVIFALLLLVPHYACQKHDGGPGTYQVVITSYDQHQRRKALKGLRDNTGVSVAVAKSLLRTTPSTVKKGLSEREAYSLARTLKASAIETKVTKE